MKSNKNKNLSQQLFYMSLVAAFLAIVFVSSFISNTYLRFIGGFPVEIYLIFYVFGILLINKTYYKIFFFISAPLLMLATPGLFFLNFGQVFLEYIIAYYVFAPFLFIKFPIKKVDQNTSDAVATISVSRKKYLFKISVFTTLLLVSVFLKFIAHVIAGYIWWVPGNIVGSLTLNAQYIFVSFAIILPMCLLLYLPLAKLNESVYLNKH